MDDLNSEWQRKGGTLSDKSARKEFGLTQDQIAAAVGKDRSSVANYLRLLKLPDDLQKLVIEGRLSTGHARTILGVVFCIAGLYQPFVYGPLQHAGRLFVEPYADTFLPVWALWAIG